MPFTFHSRAILEDFEESSEKKPTKVDFKIRNLNIHKGRSCVSNVLNFKMHIAWPKGRPHFKLHWVSLLTEDNNNQRRCNRSTRSRQGWRRRRRGRWRSWRRRRWRWMCSTWKRKRGRAVPRRTNSRRDQDKEQVTGGEAPSLMNKCQEKSN